jgi:Zn-dependent metalloprotease
MKARNYMKNYSSEKARVLQDEREWAEISAQYDERPNGLKFAIYDAGGKEKLPGRRIHPSRGSGKEAAQRMALPVYSIVQSIYDFFDRVYSYKLFKDKQRTVAVTINFGFEYQNAHWGDDMLILGEGKPHMVSLLREADDIIAHELTHGIIKHTSRLKFFGEVGALQEHLCDVFGMVYKQRRMSKESRTTTGIKDAKDYPWVIGEKLWNNYDLNPKPSGSAKTLFPVVKPSTSKLEAVEKEKLNFAKLPPYLRSFSDPESTDPAQPILYTDYQMLHYDNGGVHLNSGIPNYAFFTAAVAANGPPWEGVGKVWFRAMTNQKLGAECTFARFAAFTLAYAKKDYKHLVEPIAKGWKTVGVEVVPSVLNAVEGLVAPEQLIEYDS